jgi:hypothetical protein
VVKVLVGCGFSALFNKPQIMNHVLDLAAAEIRTGSGVSTESVETLD